MTTPFMMESFNIRRDQAQMIERLSDLTGMSRSAVVREMLNMFLDTCGEATAQAVAKDMVRYRDQSGGRREGICPAPVP